MDWKRACGIGIGCAIVAGGILGYRHSGAAELVVSAGPREPMDERKAFHLPPGFEAQLVASEPDINKPINIAFDDRGRLWTTSTVEYPFPAPEGKPTRDKVKILDDFDENGHARKITTFADNLNIPVGLLPQGDNAALIYSIPYVYRMTDTNGSGKADKREILFGPYEHLDTHGMTGSFTEGYDGWIYAVHGFRNTTTLKAKDGSTITMNSGNTYRFKRDGSHIEYFTHGQVNPFGMVLDPLGNLFTSDCETKPIALMQHEAYYSSFGKPDDGLGFGPDICDHMYGSTAIAGLCDYVADQFPPEFQNRMLVGNVVTGRINNARLTPRASGFHADDEPDFLVSDDAWFRPVNIKLGPDGALYVADFYNRIIGHYEVDLHHPGRDKERGRIWRIVYKSAGTPKKFDLTKESNEQLMEDLASPNLTVRMLAMNRLADVIGQPAVAPLKEALSRSSNVWQRVHGNWVLFRLGALEPAMLKSAATDPQMPVRVHAMRMLAEMPQWDEQHRQWALAALKDSDPTAQRVAADAIGRHPQLENVRPLLDLREKPGIDPWLLHGVRIALRDQLLAPGVCPNLPEPGMSEQDERAIADAAAGAATPEAGALLLRHIRSGKEDPQTMMRYLRSAAREVGDEQVDDLAKFAAERFANDPDQQLELFKSMEQGLAQRGGKPGPGLRAWGKELASKMLADAGADLNLWTARPLPGHSATAWRNPWVVQMRPSADKSPPAPFFSSLPLGESLTGSIRSKTFTIPPKLTFFMAGHNGPLQVKDEHKNILKLHDASNNEVLAEAAPPRNDMAQKFTLDLGKFAGRQGYIEVTDAMDGPGYSWLAFGRFDPPVVQVPASGPRFQSAVQIVQALHLDDLGPSVEKLLENKTADVETRSAAARALGALDPSRHVRALAAVLRDPSAPDEVREPAGEALGQVNAPDASSALVEAIRVAPQRLQLALAKSLATTQGGAALLLDTIAEGKASPQLLQDPNVRERLSVSKPRDWEQRLAQLTKGLPAADAQLQKLIDARAAAFDPSKASPQRGREVFTKNCAICHMVGGQGAHIGPQLDGIGVRGVPRLAEDILDPSRNVDAAFRQSTFVLNDGNILAGIVRREEGQTLVIADSTGKEIPIQKPQITRRVESKLSLMPSNFGEVLKPDEFNDLMSYLLSTKQP